MFVISDSCFRISYLVCLAFKVFNNKELWEIIRDRSGYVTRGAFILVTVDKYVVSKCCCSSCYSRTPSLWESIISRNWLIAVVFKYFIKFKLKWPASALNFFQSKSYLKDFLVSHCWICSVALRDVYTLCLQRSLICLE